MHGPYPYHPSFRLSFTALAEPGTTVQLSADNSACETWLRDGTAPAVTLFQVLSVREDNVPAQATRGGRAHAGQEIKPQLLASGARQTSHLMPHTCAHFAMLSRRFPNFLAGEAASVVYVKFRAPHIGTAQTDLAEDSLRHLAPFIFAGVRFCVWVRVGVTVQPCKVDAMTHITLLMTLLARHRAAGVLDLWCPSTDARDSFKTRVDMMAKDASPEMRIRGLLAAGPRVVLWSVDGRYVLANVDTIVPVHNDTTAHDRYTTLMRMQYDVHLKKLAASSTELRVYERLRSGALSAFALVRAYARCRCVERCVECAQRCREV